LIERGLGARPREELIERGLGARPREELIERGLGARPRGGIQGGNMAFVSSVLRHAWVPSVLVLAACSGGFAPAYKTAAGPPPPPYGPSVAPPGAGGAVAYDHAPQPTPERPGLGTTWGEQVHAPITFSPFVRSASSPWAEVLLHYNDAEGVNAHAAYLGTRAAPLEMYAGDGSIGVSLVDESGNTLPGYVANGRALVVGEDGHRYRIVVRNGTTARFEIVASVDGLDVIDGKPADPNRRGYIVDPHGVLVIDGFRTSDAAVAAFRFGSVSSSYAAQTSGDRNVGVVGFAIFSERGAVWTPAELGKRDTANPFPNRGYAVPPR
jgi:hypothetical protein